MHKFQEKLKPKGISRWRTLSLWNYYVFKATGCWQPVALKENYITKLGEKKMKVSKKIFICACALLAFTATMSAAKKSKKSKAAEITWMFWKLLQT